MKTIITNKKTTFSEQFNFGEFDSKGREIGAIASTFEADVVESENSNVFYTSFKSEGRYYGVRVQASRDGKSFGATQSIKWFDSKEKAIKHLTSRISDSQKQAIKKGMAA